MTNLSSGSPALLLLLTGSLLGLTFPLGKLASAASVSPIAWAWLVSVGAGSLLLLVRLLSGGRVATNREHLRYYLVSALVSLVIPNLLIFSVIPRLGSGFTGILFTVSPVFTLLLSMLWRVRTPSGIGLAGIAIGFCGALIAAAAVLLALLLLRGEGASLRDLATVPVVALAQVLASTAMFSLFFRLQQVGGPTYLSQIGYVAAAVALLAGTGALGERYAWTTWIGALVILVGIGLSVLAEQRRNRADAPSLKVDVPIPVAARRADAD